MRPAYRFRQFLWAISARVEPEEKVILDEYLTPAQKALFEAMEMQDQRHSLNVFHRLTMDGHTDRDLLLAALLHDVGKAAASLDIWHRVAIVLLKAFWPAILTRMASADRRSWRYPFWVHRHHGELAADTIAALGGSERLVRLTRYHQNPADDPLARALYEADEAS